MPWNWQPVDWPKFTYDSNVLEPFEGRFLLRAGEFVGVFKHVGPEDRVALRIELIGDEALKTSEIEGELLNRESVQSALRQQFGLGADNRQISPAERGIAEMMVDLYQNSGDPLSHNTMFAWHGMLMSGDVSDLAAGPAAFVREFICDECGWLWPQSEQVRTGLGSRSSALRILHLGSSKFGACGPELVWI